MINNKEETVDDFPVKIKGMLWFFYDHTRRIKRECNKLCDVLLHFKRHQSIIIVGKSTTRNLNNEICNKRSRKYQYKYEP